MNAPNDTVNDKSLALTEKSKDLLFFGGGLFELLNRPKDHDDNNNTTNLPPLSL